MSRILDMVCVGAVVCAVLVAWLVMDRLWHNPQYCASPTYDHWPSGSVLITCKSGLQVVVPDEAGR